MLKRQLLKSLLGVASVIAMTTVALAAGAVDGGFGCWRSSMTRAEAFGV